jgi:hypothetical protein
MLILAVVVLGTAHAAIPTEVDNVSQARPAEAVVDSLTALQLQTSGDAHVLSLPANTYRIVNNGNGYCLTESGSDVTLTNCSTITNQQLWYYSFAGNSGGTAYYDIISYTSGKCVQPVAGSYSNGALLTTSPCCAQCTGQWWRQQDPGPLQGMYHLRNLPSGKCMDMPISPVDHNNNWTGTAIQQWSCGSYQSDGSGLNQYWVIRNI